MARTKKDEQEVEAAPEGERMVRRELTADEIHERQLELSSKVVELLDLEEKRRRQVKKANDRINELKAEVRELAGEVRTGIEMVPAQLELISDGAKQARRRTVRGTQDAGSYVEP